MSLVEKLLQHQLSSLTISANFEATWLDDGILQLLPRCGWQQATVLSAGIHGNETAPIEQLLRLMENLVSQSDYQGHALLFIFGNIPAMQKAKRYLDYDMNRLFCGKHRGIEGDEARRVAEIEKHVSAFYLRSGEADTVPRYHLDMHTAIRGSHYPKFALIPAVHPQISTILLRLMASGELDALVQHTEPGSTFSHYTAAVHGAQSVTLELGKVQRFGENNLNDSSPIFQAIEAFITNCPLPQVQRKNLLYFNVKTSVIRGDQHFQLYLPEEIKNFTQLAAGYLLAEQPSRTWQVEEPAHYLLFPNANVAVGQRACLLLERVTDLHFS
ncbi:succinylglutamate desuccinylase [Tatumella ptyseos]|uniref:succinylglutamate desuccinylase n=1 Tax=Tatumella ptyseos TaxID=82987 RepID=UPI0026EAF3D7|nr:succinylglutamate desuccinylase [Tatumella ptyseos]WKX27661.1 succinylglutamate desuccinylase [Tatumella ptyseos]